MVQRKVAFCGYIIIFVCTNSYLDRNPGVFDSGKINFPCFFPYFPNFPKDYSDFSRNIIVFMNVHISKNCLLINWTNIFSLSRHKKGKTSFKIKHKTFIGFKKGSFDRLDSFLYIVWKEWRKWKTAKSKWEEINDSWGWCMNFWILPRFYNKMIVRVFLN